MIQRIQSVYLLIVSLLLGGMFFGPLAEIIGADGAIYTYAMKGIAAADGTIPELKLNGPATMVLTIICAVLPLITIFLFKKRPIQMRLCIINIILLLGLCGVILFTTYSAAQVLEGSFSLAMTFPIPLVGVILNYLAWRAIMKDDFLVRSVDRIR